MEKAKELEEANKLAEAKRLEEVKKLEEEKDLKESFTKKLIDLQKMEEAEKIRESITAASPAEPTTIQSKDAVLVEDIPTLPETDHRSESIAVAMIKTIELHGKYKNLE